MVTVTFLLIEFLHVYSAGSFNFLAVVNNPELIGVLTQIDITLITSLLLLIAFGG